MKTFGGPKPEHPVPPPLPEFLKRLNTEPAPLKQLRLDKTDSPKQSMSSLTSSATHSDILMMHQHYYQQHLGEAIFLSVLDLNCRLKCLLLEGQPDLHHRLIQEIHDKSLERSRKDSLICFDERGNLIVENTQPGRLKSSEKHKCFNHRRFEQVEEEESDNRLDSTSKGMLSEARAKLEQFSSKFPCKSDRPLNDGLGYLNSLNFESNRSKLCTKYFNNSVQRTLTVQESFKKNQLLCSKTKF